MLNYYTRVKTSCINDKITTHIAQRNPHLTHLALWFHPRRLHGTTQM